MEKQQDIESGCSIRERLGRGQKGIVELYSYHHSWPQN
jgi:hypothetical protein